MGEIADAMIDGDLCAGCGGFIDEEGGEGVPRYCDMCGPAYVPPVKKNKRRKKPKRNAVRLNAFMEGGLEVATILKEAINNLELSHEDQQLFTPIIELVDVFIKVNTIEKKELTC